MADAHPRVLNVARDQDNMGADMPEALCARVSGRPTMGPALSLYRPKADRQNDFAAPCAADAPPQGVRQLGRPLPDDDLLSPVARSHRKSSAADGKNSFGE